MTAPALAERDFEFSYDWFSNNIAHWTKILGPLAGSKIDYLEIGSWEGRSAIFIGNLLPHASLTCVDIWDYPPAEERFDRNIAHLGKRLTKIKARSVAAIDALWEKSAAFDVIYVDANHTRWSTLANGLLAWPLLRTGGIMIFDDYLLDLDKPRDERPQDGIDLFQKSLAGCYAELHRDWQVVVRKTADWPERRPVGIGLTNRVSRTWRGITGQ